MSDSGHYNLGLRMFQVNTNLYSSPEDHTAAGKSKTVAGGFGSDDSQSGYEIRKLLFAPQATPAYPFLLVPNIHWARIDHYLHLAVEATIQGVRPDMTVTT